MGTRADVRTRALAFLEQRVAQVRREHGSGRLPTLRRLAAEADVSKGAMSAALKELVSRGELRARTGAGIRLVTAGDQAGATGSESPGAQRGWRRIHQEIARDILRGVFEKDCALPGVALLARRYGGCYRTVRKALAGLREEGLLAEERRRLLVKRPYPAQSSATVVLLTGASLLRNLDNFERFDETYRLLESECARSGMRLVAAGYAPEEGRFYDTGGQEFNLVRIRRNHPVLGSIVWCSSLEIRALELVIHHALEFGGPVAVLDEDAVTEEIASGMDMRRVRVFLIGCSEGPGLAVGRYLYALGHRRVLYIAPFHSERAAWSHRRLTGLRRAFSAGQGAQWVKEVAATEYFFAGDYAREHPDLREKVGAALRSLQSREGLEEPLARAVAGRLEQQVPALLDDEYTREVCVSLFKRAGEYPDATAWVCDCDQTAVFALDFLAAKRIRVPATVSVVGFDDIRASSRAKLTTYGFDLSGMTRAMLAHVASPWNGSRDAVRTTDVEGYLVVRQTAGRPPAAGEAVR